MHDLNEDSRRRYWTEQMEAAYEFMMTMQDYPVDECHEPLASMPDAARAAGVKVEFSTSKIAGDLDRIFYLREGLINDFVEAARAMNQRGWLMKVEDGYRSVTMQTLLARKETVFDQILATTKWETGDSPSAELMLRRLTGLSATSAKTGTHVSASAIDISVYSLADGSEIDRGGPYLEMSELTPMESPFVSAAALRNRLEITDIMAESGFVAYPFEFWHYNKSDAYDEFLNKAGKPARYGPVHWDAVNNRVLPVENSRAPLQSKTDIEAAIAAAYERATT